MTRVSNQLRLKAQWAEFDSVNDALLYQFFDLIPRLAAQSGPRRVRELWQLPEHAASAR